VTGGRLTDLVPRFRGLRALVIGEAMLDAYLYGTPRELCREAPVPIVDVLDRRESPGGAGNTATNLAALGADVRLLSVVGDDREGRSLVTRLREQGVDADGVVVEPGRGTLLKQRVIASDQMVVRFDAGTTEPASQASVDRLCDGIRRVWNDIDCVVISDYAYGVLTSAVRSTLAEMRRRRPDVTVVVDAKHPTEYAELSPTVVKPNYGEAVRLLGLAPVTDGRVDQIATRGHEVLDHTGAAFAAITVDRDGALLFGSDGATFRSEARPSGDMRSAGAGDTFVAAIALAFAAGGDPATSLELAQVAATAVVDRDGTACCSLEELILHAGSHDAVIADADIVAAWADALRARGERVAFTNGCFDILHRGHTTFLEQARKLADALIVGLNDDASVRRLKGPGRPVNRLDDRAEVLAGLASVDLVVPFSEDQPLRLIERVRPDVYVKGADYTEATLPEAPLVRRLGGRVELLPLVPDRSTTGLIETLREGAEKVEAGEVAGVEQVNGTEVAGRAGPARRGAATRTR
jgi:D-beta-D-heptose 7-phosphate kinase/D-beta-D-heptose 1-phosphate adenosyltransferase